MARRTVKVTIPRGKPDDFIVLCENIIEKHEQNPVNSPVNAGDVKLLKPIVTRGKQLRDKSVKLRKQSESLMEQANVSLGIERGQRASDKGTGLFLVNKIKKALLSAFQGEEEQMSEFGFNVVTGQSKSPTRKPPAR